MGVKKFKVSLFANKQTWWVYNSSTTMIIESGSTNQPLQRDFPWLGGRGWEMLGGLELNEQPQGMKNNDFGDRLMGPASSTFSKNEIGIQSVPCQISAAKYPGKGPSWEPR